MHERHRAYGKGSPFFLSVREISLRTPVNLPVRTFIVNERGGATDGIPTRFKRSQSEVDLPRPKHE